MAKIYYVGDWAVLNGPVFAESPFNFEYKGIEIFNYGKWLKKALESSGKNEVNSVPSWDFYKLAPGEYEKILADYDVLIFSDVEAKLFQLAPSFFDHEKFGTEILTFPDRIRLTIDSVKAGKSVMFLGGWLSFNGEMGKGGWGRTRLKEILPVQCLDYEDLIESTEGFTSLLKNNWVKKFKNIDFTSIPPILGYNKTLPREGFDVVIEFKETGDPMLAYGEIGKGKVLAYMSDPAPHWGCNFVFWKHYNQFWLDCLELITE
jgi:uncharacterized membrane protein